MVRADRRRAENDIAVRRAADADRRPSGKNVTAALGTYPDRRHLDTEPVRAVPPCSRSPMPASPHSPPLYARCWPGSQLRQIRLNGRLPPGFRGVYLSFPPGLYVRGHRTVNSARRPEDANRGRSAQSVCAGHRACTGAGRHRRSALWRHWTQFVSHITFPLQAGDETAVMLFSV